MSNDNGYEEYDRYIESLKKLLSENYSQARSYSNIIIFAGYASYFTALNYCRVYLPASIFLWSILLMTLSVILFVFFEIYGMISTTINLRKFEDALSDRKNYIQNLENYNKAAQREKIRLGRIWSYSLYSTLLFAIGAIVIFLLSLGARLLVK